MKSFRKTLQESRLKTHHLIRSWLQPKLGAVGTRYRLAGRIRLANIWARKHPRRTFAYVTGSLFFLLVSTVLIDGVGQQIIVSRMSAVLPSWNPCLLGSAPFRQTRASIVPR